jgi:hypothetical protein
LPEQFELEAIAHTKTTAVIVATAWGSGGDRIIGAAVGQGVGCAEH